MWISQNLKIRAYTAGCRPVETEAIQVHLENQVAQLFSSYKHFQSYHPDQGNKTKILLGNKSEEAFVFFVFVLNWKSSQCSSNSLPCGYNFYQNTWEFCLQNSQDIFWGHWKRQVESWSLMKKPLSRDTCVISAFGTCPENCPLLPNLLHCQNLV